MKVTSYAVARPAYYDRNGTASLLAYNASSIAPHGHTQRFTATVASGKKATVELWMLASWRETAATTTGTRYVVGTITSGATVINAVTMISQVNTTFSQVISQAPMPITLYASEVLETSTFDGSIGGTLAFWLSAKLTTFDA